MLQAINILWIILSCFCAYLIGAIPFSVWIGRLVKGVDVRDYNTGNPGAINSIKTFGFGLGLFIMLLDISKGSLVIFLIDQLFSHSSFISQDGSNPSYTLMCLLGPFFAILGHNYSVWLKFKGGQGMGVFMGTLLYVNPLIFVLCGLVMLIPSGFFKASGRVSGATGVLLSIPIALFLPLAPPWSGVHTDWLLGSGSFVHLTQGFLVAAMVLAMFSSLLIVLFTRSRRGSTNWFSKN